MNFYYINLKKSTIRNQNMINFFKKLSENINLETRRIEGFDGRNENIDDYLIDFQFKDLNGSYFNDNVFNYGFNIKTNKLHQTKLLSYRSKSPNFKINFTSNISTFNDFIFCFNNVEN